MTTFIVIIFIILIAITVLTVGILMSGIQIISYSDDLKPDDWELILQTLNQRYEYLSSLTFDDISVEEITEYENLEKLIKICQNCHSKSSLKT